MEKNTENSSLIEQYKALLSGAGLLSADGARLVTCRPDDDYVRGVGVRIEYGPDAGADDVMEPVREISRLLSIPAPLIAAYGDGIDAVWRAQIPATDNEWAAWVTRSVLASHTILPLGAGTIRSGVGQRGDEIPISPVTALYVPDDWTASWITADDAERIAGLSSPGMACDDAWTRVGWNEIFAAAGDAPGTTVALEWGARVETWRIPVDPVYRLGPGYLTYDPEHEAARYIAVTPGTETLQDVPVTKFLGLD